MTKHKKTIGRARIFPQNCKFKSINLFLWASLIGILLASCDGGNVRTRSASDEYIGSFYETVITELKKTGFSDIESNIIDDLTSTSLNPDGTVESVSINNVTNFKEKEKFPRDAKVVVTYHIIPKLEVPLSSDKIQAISYQEIGQLFTDNGFKNVTIEEVFDLDPDTFKGEFENEVSINGQTTFKEKSEYPFDADISVFCHRPFEKYTLQVHVECVGNLLFSKYDVDISLDGVKKETIEHGKEADYTFTVKAGSHELKFSEKGASSVNGSVIIDEVASDIEVSYKIYCHSDDVSIDTVYIDRKEELSANEAKVTCSELDFWQKNYKDVMTSLASMGFTNIKTVPVYDISLGITERESVSRVTIAGATDYKRGDIFSKNAEVLITYHMLKDDDPSKIKMPNNNSKYSQMNYLDVEQELRNIGFTNIKLNTVEDSSGRNVDGIVSMVKIDGKSFEKGDIFDPNDIVEITYWTKAKAEYHSTNDLDIAKEGNSGVFSYKKASGTYDIYYIIDFDEKYVYRFCDGNGDETCDRLKITKGDLNDKIIVTYHSGSDTWDNGLHFRFKNKPSNLILEDNDHYEYTFKPTNLNDALELRDSKTIVDY